MSKFNNIGKHWQFADLSANVRTADVLMRENVSVFPCHEGGSAEKAPCTSRGFHAASTNPVLRKIWSQNHPHAVWGLPCASNNVLVLDADRHGHGDGVESLFALFREHHFDSRSVPAVTTPNRGMHFYFKRPSGLTQTRGTLLQAVDIRDNAYVIAPGCCLADGRQYELVEGTLEQFARTLGGQCLPEPPDWMLPMLIRPSLPRRTYKPAFVDVDEEYLKNQLKGIFQAVLRAEEGNRNRLLFWGACRLAEMVRAGLLDLETVEMLLDEAGARLGLSARETRGTAISGLRTILGRDDDAC